MPCWVKLEYTVVTHGYVPKREQCSLGASQLGLKCRAATPRWLEPRLIFADIGSPPLVARCRTTSTDSPRLQGMQVGNHFSTPQVMRFGLTIRAFGAGSFSYFACPFEPRRPLIVDHR